MSDTTIFKLEDLDSANSEIHIIKVKAKKNNETSNFATLLVRLETPTISLNGDILTINPVTDAQFYELYNYNVKFAETNNTTYDLSQLGSGVIMVKAISNNYLYPSRLSNSVHYNTSTTFTNVSGLGNEDPTTVTFIKDTNFTLQGLGIEEVTKGTDVFIKIPTMYRKVNTVSSNQITSFTIANAKIDNDYYPYPCFLDESGNLLDYVLIGKYWNTSSDSCISTTEGTAITVILADGRTYAQARGTGYQLFDWQMQKLWQDLIICFKETVNTHSGSTWTYDELGIYWANVDAWIDGVIGSGGTWRFCYKPSKYVSLSSTSDPIPSDYVSAGYSRPTSSNEIQKLGYDSNNPFFNYPSAVISNNNYNTYYCDQYYYSSGNRPVRSYVGGTALSTGAFDCYAGLDWSGTGRVRLCYRPIGD